MINSLKILEKDLEVKELLNYDRLFSFVNSFYKYYIKI